MVQVILIFKFGLIILLIKYYFIYDFVVNLLVGNKICYVYMIFIILFVGLFYVQVLFYILIRL